MKFHSLRSSLTGTLLAIASSLILGSCGGGGATTNPGQGGGFQILPKDATFYAGIPATIQVLGGRGPYAITSSEPGILPVPNTLNGNILEVVPTNPGVVDTGLAAGDLPVRSVTVTAREVGGASDAAVIKVAQNFLLGYNVSMVASGCATPAGTGGTGGTTTTVAPQACAGGQTTVTLASVFNGSLMGDRSVTLQAIKGPYSWVFPTNDISSGSPVITDAGKTLTAVTDHSGRLTAIMQVDPNVPTQVAVLRVIDTQTGAYIDNAFVIEGSTNGGALTAIPSKLSFTGALTSDCGTGSATVSVLDGAPPYMATSSDLSVRVTPATSNTNPGTFTIEATNPNLCLTGATVLITDSVGARATVTVDTLAGGGSPPTLTVSPAALNLACSSSASVAVVGGSGSYSVVSSHPRVTAVVLGNTITVTRLGAPANPDPAPPYAPTASLLISDGATVVTVVATVPISCT